VSNTIKMRIINIVNPTISDGPGIRYSIYFAGCNHNCQGCHNQGSWDPNSGTELTEQMSQDIFNKINQDDGIQGVTLSGGDPFYNPKELLEFLINYRKNCSKNLWIYTGYTIEELIKKPELAVCLQYIDTIVEGKFIEAQKDLSLSFRGSKNQRIINVKEFLNEIKKE
jgi:anaerobic ribonucleoside-triphosphate reductase activating protein